MKIFKIDKKTNFLHLIPETLDDLWVLNIILTEDDLIGSKTTRRFRVEGSTDSEKKTVFIKIKLEKKQLDLKLGVLKLTGTIIAGHPEEFVDLNSHHSLELMEGVEIKIEKQKILEYEISLLKKAEKNSLLPKIILLVLDDESAQLAKVDVRKFDLLANIKSTKSGKRFATGNYRKTYFDEIYGVLKNIEKDLVIVAGPGFEKEHFQNFIGDKEDCKDYRFVHINSTGISGLNELLKGGSVKNFLNDFKVQKDSEIIDEIFKQIAREGKVGYGLKDINTALKGNAIKELVITDSFFMSNYHECRKIFISLDKLGTKYHIIVSDSDAGGQLDSIGGVAALLFYKLE
jgi:protein pelota